MEERGFSDISYDKFLIEEKLMGSRCKECGTRFVPPRSICESCYSSEMEWVEMTGKGKLAAFTCISIAPPGMIAQGYDRDTLLLRGGGTGRRGTRIRPY